jgi:hypothetical protein
MHLNPMNYLSNAWNAADSIWGKIAIVLFYTFIWLQIIWAAEIVIWPRVGWECFYEGLSEYAAAGIEKYLVAMNILAIGFYLYADRGGIKVWNVVMVCFFNTWWSLIMLPGFKSMGELEGAPQGCDDIIIGASFVLKVLLWWPIAVLLCSVMEHINTPTGTSAETAPIV